MRAIHTIHVKDGSLLKMPDQLILGFLNNVANSAGGGAGQSVSVSITTFKNLPVDGSGNGTYGVQVTPNQDAVCFVTNKTASGFTVTLNPRLAANTLQAGTFDVEVKA